MHDRARAARPTPCPDDLRVVSTPCREADDFLLPRACRPFRSRGTALADPTPARDENGLAAFLLAAPGPVLLVRPGAWPVAARLGLPPVGEDTFLAGIVTRDEDAKRWKYIMARTGGNLRILPWVTRLTGLPLPPLCLLGSNAARKLAGQLVRGFSLAKAIHRVVSGMDGVRAAVHPALHCAFAPHLRIMQAITSIQRGGAERVCLDQAEWIARTGGGHSAVAVLGRPGRAAWNPPFPLIDLSSTPARPQARADALLGAADAWGADAVHVHLLSAQTTTELKRRGIPVAVTLHNQPAAWPTGTLDLPACGQADLLLGCSRSVAESIAQHFTGAAPPIRASPNGVQHHPLSAPAATAAREEWRAHLGCQSDEVLLLAVANPRPQKRLEALPAIAAAAAALDPLGRRFLMAVAGSPGEASEGAAESRDVLLAAKAARPEARTVLLGDVPRTAPLMAAADVLVCCSRHEGLSLSWLEALREGLPVATAEVGAAAEVAAESANSFHLAPPGDDAALAAAILRALGSPRPSLPPAYSARAMAARSAALCQRVASLKSRTAHSRQPSGVWIVTCNLALGGAQSSCRRLLETIHARGIPARCAVVEEQPNQITLGSKSLRAAGVTVHCIAPGRPTAQALDLLARMDADPPAAVLFWNLPPVLRVLLADLMLDAARVIDVSPGEMSFRSLGRFFDDPGARTGLPYPDARAYGQLLHYAVVKYAGEAETAASVLGCPVAVIPNGVPLPTPPCARPLENTSGPMVFGTAARLSPDKRLEELTEAFRLAHPSLPAGSRLLIAGEPDGTSRPYARGLRRSCAGLPIKFLGRLDGAELENRFHRQLDAFVMISHPAGCPNASLEAMAAGLPVIATDWGGAREQVFDQITGLLTPDNDPPALARALLWLAAHPQARASMARNARERASTEFSLDRMADAYLQVGGIHPASHAASAKHGPLPTH